MEAVLPASTSRPLARRRREHRGQRQEELLSARMPDRDAVHRLSMAVVRPNGSRTTTVRRDPSWTPTVKAPPRQVLTKTKDFGYTNPYTEKRPAKVKPSRASEVGSAPKNRHHHHHKVSSGSGQWVSRNVLPVKAKVDSHWFKPNHQHHHHHHHQSNPQIGQGEGSGMPKAKNKFLAGAHQELELMLTRIERARDYLPPPPPPSAAKRRNQVTQVRGVTKAEKADKVEKIAKGVRRHMGQPPPVPPGSPMNSARQNTATEAEQLQRQMAIPLVHNPQGLAPAKRDALLELLQRTEQHDRGIVDIVRSAKGGNRSARDTMRMMLQVLPLSLTESPYSGRVRKGAGPLKNGQELQQSPRTDLKEVKILPLQELRDEKKALVHVEKKIQLLNERQAQAMRERAELDQHKERVTICREERRQREHRKQLAEVRKQGGGDMIDEGVIPPRTIRLKDPLAPAPSPAPVPVSTSVTVPLPINPWKQLLQERDRFLDHCQRSYFYNNSRSPAPWKIYAKVASKLSSQIVDSVDTEINRIMQEVN